MKNPLNKDDVKEAIKEFSDEHDKMGLSGSARAMPVQIQSRGININVVYLIFFPILIFLLFVYGSQIIIFLQDNVLTFILLTFFGKYYNALFLAWFQILTTYWMILLGFTLILPIKWKSKQIGLQKELLYGLIFIFIFLSITYLYTSTAVSPEQYIAKTSQRLTASTDNFWDRFGCYLTLDYECIQKQANSADAKTTSQQNFDISFTKPFLVTRTLSDWQKKGQKIYINIQTSDDIFLQKLECYENSISVKNLISTEMINRNFPSTNLVKTNIKNLYCNFSNLKHTNSLKTDEIKIIPVLYYSINTEFEVSIPILTKQKLGNLVGKDINDDDFDLQEVRTPQLQILFDKNFNIFKSNDALDFTLYNKYSIYPQIFDPHKNKDSDTNFDVEVKIKKNNMETAMGDPIAITNIKEPEVSNFFKKLKPDNINFTKGSEVFEFDHVLELAQNLDAINKIGNEVIRVAPIKYSTQTTFKISNYFSIYIKKKETDKLDSSNAKNEVNPKDSEIISKDDMKDTNNNAAIPVKDNDEIARYETLKSKFEKQKLEYEKVKVGSSAVKTMEKIDNNIQTINSLSEEISSMLNADTLTEFDTGVIDNKLDELDNMLVTNEELISQLSPP